MNILKYSKVHHPRAFTLIEMMVVLGIFSLLLALLFPALQSAREAARRSQCAYNLRQLGLGIQGYIADFSTFPPGSLPSSIRPESTYYNFYSPLSRMLPYLDQLALYNSINFTKGTLPVSYRSTRKKDDRVGQLSVVNSTVYQTVLNIFLCPSDGGNFVGAGCAYRGNTGVGPYGVSNVLHPDSGNGLLPNGLAIPESFVPDGLSHTVAFSERIRGTGNPDQPSPSRDTFDAGVRKTRTADETLKTCQLSAFEGAPTWTDGGKWWFWTGRDQTLYSHTQTPNGIIPDCLREKLASIGMATARSNHLGGVNVIMGDMSIRFITETIDQFVWRGLGSRNGGELID